MHVHDDLNPKIVFSPPHPAPSIYMACSLLYLKRLTGSSLSGHTVYIILHYHCV